MISATRLVSAQVAAGSHAFGKVQPQLGVLRIFAGGIVAALLVGQVGEHGAAQFAFFETHAEFGQIGGERVYVMIVVARILAEIVARQFARASRLCKRDGTADRTARSARPVAGRIPGMSCWPQCFGVLTNIRAPGAASQPQIHIALRSGCDGHHRTIAPPFTYCEAFEEKLEAKMAQSTDGDRQARSLRPDFIFGASGSGRNPRRRRSSASCRLAAPRARG